MRSSILRCCVLTLLTIGVAWYAKVSVAQLQYDDGSIDENPTEKVVQDRERPIRFFDT